MIGKEDSREVSKLGKTFQRHIPGRKYVEGLTLAVRFKQQLRGFVAKLRRPEADKPQWHLLALDGREVGSGYNQEQVVREALRLRW